MPTISCVANTRLDLGLSIGVRHTRKLGSYQLAKPNYYASKTPPLLAFVTSF
ncbi:MAG: hypothetical protein J6U11_05570 [Campylobacter sp.]|nr:hypothetical protein [Campylobacter sp.]